MGSLTMIKRPKTGDGQRKAPSSLRRRFTSRVDVLHSALVNTFLTNCSLSGLPDKPAIFHSKRRLIAPEMPLTEVKQWPRSQQKKTQTSQWELFFLDEMYWWKNRLPSSRLLRATCKLQTCSAWMRPARANNAISVAAAQTVISHPVEDKAE